MERGLGDQAQDEPPGDHDRAKVALSDEQPADHAKVSLPPPETASVAVSSLSDLKLPPSPPHNMLGPEGKHPRPRPRSRPGVGGTRTNSRTLRTPEGDYRYVEHGTPRCI